ncbi:DUF47 family protein [Fodinisporobacter ferrooxydans]|uniref:DUF47 family protein n=1 Tax=Fodinisporobacter ferrooxydans TaxID=2901836 RepID=A0ABY4CHQ6_9BACL|nr:DUF47 family protein [Alicyclobacillaceae bacterium MYW30-H2]
MFKKQSHFFDMLVDAVKHLYESSVKFREAFYAGEIQGSEFAIAMKELERKADEKTHAIIAALNATYLTPIDREDILALASKIDDVMDGIEACASRFDLYDITQVDTIMKSFATNIERTIAQLLSAFSALQSRRTNDIHQYCVAVNALEEEGDQLLRNGIKSLFKREKDPIVLIKIKEIYEILEDVTDSCEDVANVLESVVMTNA